VKWLLQLLGGGIPDQLRRAYEAKLNAANDSDRIAAEVQVARLEARQASHAIGGRWITMIQIGFALPFVLYNAKLVVYDKMMGLGVTDPLSPALYDLQSVIIGFFFVTTTVRAVVGR
jgi:hypothetical protein